MTDDTAKVLATGRTIRLRDVTPADADRFDELERAERTDGGYNDFGTRPDPIDRELLARGPLRSERNGVLLIERIADRLVVGTIGWHRVTYGGNEESKAWNIGIQLAAEARGHGYGSEAQALLAEYLFASTDAHRVEASTDVENIAEQRALEKAGFTREGSARGAQFRGGTYHDLVLYGKLRSDPR